MSEPQSKAKSFTISKRLVYEAWEKVRDNDGAPGVDAVSIRVFGADEVNNLYKLWLCRAGDYAEPAVTRRWLCWSRPWALASSSA
jgi:hypothetical protein